MRHLSNVYLRAAEAFHNHICYNAFQFAEKRGDFKWCVKTYHTVGRAQTVDALLKSLGSNSSGSYPEEYFSGWLGG